MFLVDPRPELGKPLEVDTFCAGWAQRDSEQELQAALAEWRRGRARVMRESQIYVRAQKRLMAYRIHSWRQSMRGLPLVPVLSIEETQQC